MDAPPPIPDGPLDTADADGEVTTPDWPGVRLHVVTGKGGTGKTTVAAALALTLASLGRRILLVEVEGRQGISQVLDVPPLSKEERLLMRVSGGGEIWGLSVEVKAALLEYLDIFYKLGRAGSVLERTGAIDFATTVAPGVRDVLVVGKVYESVRRHRQGGTQAGPPWAYDAVVLDAPPTGRIGHVLNVNEEVAELAKVGPIRGQADSITRMLRSGTAVVHLTTLLEDMPVQETVDAVAELAGIQVPVGAVVVNQARDEILSPETLAALTGDEHAGSARDDARRAEIGAALESAGLPGTDDVVDALLAQARDHAERIDLENELLTVLADLGRPLYVLPRVAGGADPGGVRILAQQLAEQAVWQ
ncbi:ArsA-related P-loop ATPase [Mobilicoccus pelagius]|uniref:ArsA/GET3 Anion-transporting ATPase-like domain-containing protein n=1 Tax=Mobilicoccus pelagius NBRC 104925 TaxID=1089455 RepID=H5UP85_9MICO|nr:ArsA-related P-loop ATPase [Mobilicoccus pelagius]GAB47543.1 hypothetical protein MOPEL_020_00290 [Mobilicoccus pelagius NBRC 104925]